MATHRLVQHFTRRRLQELFPTELGRVQIPLAVALSLEDPLLVEPRHRRHHRGVGDVPLLLEDGEHVTDGEGRELLAPHHVHDGGLEAVKTEFEALLPWSKAERHGWLLRWLVIY
ncbi:MAG: hypothetical protein L6Q76_03610 [Polyangiaceae bacterium]|nr:hypothetical protein [Polyangiaceae bacterium]